MTICFAALALLFSPHKVTPDFPCEWPDSHVNTIQVQTADVSAVRRNF